MRLLPCAAAGAALLLALSTSHAQQPTPPDAPPGAAQPAAPPDTPPPDPGAQPPADPGQKPAGEAQPPTQPPPQPPAKPAPVDAAAATAPPAAAPAPDAFAPGWRERIGASLGPIRIRPIVLLQAQLAPYVGEDSFLEAGDVAERPGFRLRRARLGFGGDVADQARFAVSLQLGSEDEGTVLVHDAWAGYTKLPYLQIFAGAREVPFSRSALTGSGDLALIELPLAVRAIAPGTQVGVQAEGHFGDGVFSYQAGAFNAFQRSDRFYAGHRDSYAPLGNRFEGIAAAARVQTEPLGPLGRTIQDVGHSPFRIGAGGGYYVSAGGARTIHGAGGDVLLHAAGVHVLAELLWTQARPQSVPTQPITQVAPVSSLGIVGEAGYMILPRTLGLSGRVEWIDPNPDVDNEGDNVAISAGLSFHALDDLMKAQLDFTHREELFGLSIANDAVTLQLQLSL